MTPQDIITVAVAVIGAWYLVPFLLGLVVFVLAGFGALLAGIFSND